MVKNNSYTDPKLRYLSQSVLLEESVVPVTLRFTLMLISSVTLGLIIWAALTDIDELAVTDGEVIPSQHIQAIQHLAFLIVLCL